MATTPEKSKKITEQSEATRAQPHVACFLTQTTVACFLIETTCPIVKLLLQIPHVTLQ